MTEAHAPPLHATAIASDFQEAALGEKVDGLGAELRLRKVAREPVWARQSKFIHYA